MALGKKLRKGYNDLDFKNAHKEPGYVGLWSFEAAAPPEYSK